MKKLFHKAITVLGGLTLIGATLSGALAASYSSLTGSNTAVVVGVSALASDSTAAARVVADLGVGTGSVVVEGGDSYKLEKSYDNFNIGEALGTIVSKLTDDEMENFLAEGTFKNKTSDEIDYAQFVDLGTGTPLSYFSDKEYNNKEATLGFVFAKGANVLNYTIDFDEPLTSMVGSDIPLLGANYYVKSATATKLELFDSSSSVEVNEGGTQTLTVGGKSYEVSVSYIESTGARFVVNGESLGKITNGSSQKLSDGSHILLKETFTSSKESIPSTAEFTIGSGLVVLEHNKAVKIGDKDVKGLSAEITGGDVVKIVWDANEKTFLTEDNEIIMPGFQALKVVFGGVEFSELEETAVVPGDELVLSLELKDGSYDLPILSYDSSRGAGKKLTIGDIQDNVYLFSTDLAGLDEDDEGSLIIVSSVKNTSGEEYRTQVYEIDSVSEDDGQIVLSSLVDDSEITVKDGRTVTKGNVNFAYTNATGTLAITGVTGFTVDDNLVYTVNGLTVDLSALKVNATNGDLLDDTGNFITLYEPTYEGKIASTNGLKLTLSLDGGDDDDEIHVASVALAGITTSTKTNEDKIETGYIESEMASMYVFDKDDDLNTFSIFVGEEEAVADVSVASGTARITTPTGAVPLKDSEVASVDKNLVVVGGSAVNTVAAELLGGSYRGAEFTEHTNVGEGQFMIKAFNRGGKTALLVAGYEAADTTRAVSYLLENAKTISLTNGEGKVYSTATATVVA